METGRVIQMGRFRTAPSAWKHFPSAKLRNFKTAFSPFWSKVSLFGTFWSIVSFNSVLWGFFQGNSLFSSLFSFPLFFFLPECEIVPELFLPIHPIFLVLIFSCYYLYYSGVFRPLCLSVHACGESCLCVHTCGDHACVNTREEHRLLLQSYTLLRHF